MYSQSWGQHRAFLKKEQRNKNLADLIAGGMMLAILVLAALR